MVSAGRYENGIKRIRAVVLLAMGTLFFCAFGSILMQEPIIWGGVERAYAAEIDGWETIATYVDIEVQSQNSKAHAAYKKKLRDMYKDSGVYDVPYAFVDLNRDGIDELVISWFPGIYSYSGGKVKRVDRSMTGSSSYSIAPKAKMFCRIQPDHCGSATYRYFKWNGKKFVCVATMYTHDKRDTFLNAKSKYWVKGKGNVSKKTAAKYVKKILNGSKLQSILSYEHYRPRV